MICFPNAKINLGLNVVSKRSDGYHNLETVFYPVMELKDALEIVPAQEKKGGFKQSGIQIDGDVDNNLVMKAMSLLQENYPLPEIDIYLRKNIPFGAGLGGGSSDAAFMLKLLNEFARLQLSDEELEQYASRIGADCPFFIKNKPVLATGIGNVFEPIDLSLEGYYLALVKPEIHVSTKEAYAMVKPQTPKIALSEIVKRPVETWKNIMVNDFEESVFFQYPEIRNVKEKMYELGAIYASMSGSGSSVFGIFQNKIENNMDDFSGKCFFYKL